MYLVFRIRRVTQGGINCTQQNCPNSKSKQRTIHKFQMYLGDSYVPATAGCKVVRIVDRTLHTTCLYCILKIYYFTLQNLSELVSRFGATSRPLLHRLNTTRFQHHSNSTLFVPHIQHSSH